MNKLYFGDNLEIMREMDTGAVDLICTDPPFNSGRNYNSFFEESQAQNKAFADIWTWDDEAKNARTKVENPSHQKCDLDTYKALDKCLKGYDMVLQDAISGNKGSMRAYLAFMGPRLAEMHRLLKDTGSIYLHCDPTASHYLKGVMDAIFDVKNYRNEIVWHYHTGGASKRWFAKKHDTLLFYSRSDKYHFFSERIRVPRTPKSLQRAANPKGARISASDKDKLALDVWTDIPAINPMAKERLGYPTQKPITLYERMIIASSNPGDLVLDPFCGCGTTIDAAHTQKRLWMGIDLTIIALDPMRKRLRERHGLEPSDDYEIQGYPSNMQEVRKLVRDENKRHDFSNWAVTRLGFTPTRDVGDGGKDGVKRVMLWGVKHGDERQVRFLAEVKSGHPTIEQVRAFCHTMTHLDAIAGIFITIETVSDGMRQIAADMGNFKHNNVTYPKLQFWQIDDDYFNNPDIVETRIRLPAEWLRPIHKSERHFEDTQIPLEID